MYVLTCSTFFIADEISPECRHKKGSINNGKLTTRNMYLYLLHYHYYNELFIIVFDECNVLILEVVRFGYLYLQDVHN